MRRLTCIITAIIVLFSAYSTCIAEEVVSEPRSVAYIDGESLGAGSGTGAFLMCGNENYYTSADGLNWTKRGTGSFGKIKYNNDKYDYTVTDGIAFGETEGVKKGLIVSTVFGNDIYMINSSLELSGAAECYDEDGNALTVTAVCYDAKNQLFWCGANVISGSSYIDFGYVYYSKCVPDENNKIIWTKVNDGSSVFDDVNADRGYKYAKYTFITADMNGYIAAGTASRASGCNDACRSFTLINAQDMDNIRFANIYMGDNLRIFGEAADGYPIGTGGSQPNTASEHKNPFPVVYAEFDGAGGLVLCTDNGFMRSGKWYRMIRFDYSELICADDVTRDELNNSKRFTWLLNNNSIGSNFGFCVVDGDTLYGIPTNSAARTGSNRNSAYTDITQAKRNSDGLWESAAKILNDEDKEKEFFGSETAYYVGSAAAHNDILLICQYVSTDCSKTRLVAVDASLGEFETTEILGEAAKLSVASDNISFVTSDTVNLSALIDGEAADEGSVVFKKLGGDESYTLAENGTLTLNAESNRQIYRICVGAFLAENNSVFNIVDYEIPVYGAAVEAVSSTVDESGNITAEISGFNGLDSDINICIAVCIMNGDMLEKVIARKDVIPSGEAAYTKALTDLQAGSEYAGRTVKMYVINESTCRDIIQ